jgi:hypothetical protein
MTPHDRAPHAAQLAEPPIAPGPGPRRSLSGLIPQTWRPDPVAAFRLVLIAGFLVMLAANMPGQLSYDSIVELHEGRHHIRETWAPAILSAILGRFDALIPGTGLYLIASGLLAYGALLALRGLRPTMSWAGPAVAALAVSLPTLVIFQGDVWKDVLFANLVVAAFVLLAHVGKVWGSGRTPWLALLGVLLALAAAAQARQNGLVAALAAALVIAWIVRAGGWRASLAWGLGGLAAVVLVSQAMGVASLPASARHGHDNATAQGLIVLQRFDIMGALAHEPGLTLTDIKAADPEAERLIRLLGAPLYSPERVDYLDQDMRFVGVINRVPSKAIAAQWRHVVLQHTRAYLAHRWNAFRWVFLTPEIDSCLPIYVGVDGPEAMVKDLKLVEGVSPSAQSLFNYGSYFLDGPAFSHLAYAVVALVVSGLLLLRREPQDMAIVGLMIAALGFSASFFLISIACDYRYLYLLDLAAVTGLIYLAIDPPLAQLRRRR